MKFITNHIIHYSGSKRNFCFHNGNTEHYEYTNKTVVIKLSF